MKIVDAVDRIMWWLMWFGRFLLVAMAGVGIMTLIYRYATLIASV